MNLQARKKLRSEDGNLIIQIARLDKGGISNGCPPPIPRLLSQLGVPVVNDVTST